MWSLLGGLMVGFLMMFAFEFLVLNFFRKTEDVRMTAKVEKVEVRHIGKEEDCYYLVLDNGMHVCYFGKETTVTIVAGMVIEFEGNRSYLYRSAQKRSRWLSRPIIYNVKCLSKERIMDTDTKRMVTALGFESIINDPKDELSFNQFRPYIEARKR